MYLSYCCGLKIKINTNPGISLKPEFPKWAKLPQLDDGDSKVCQVSQEPRFVFIYLLAKDFHFLMSQHFRTLVVIPKSPFVVRIFGQMASRPSRPSRWALLLLFASKAELLPEICEPKLGPDLIQILGSDKRVIVIGYSCQISQEVGILEEYFCIQIRSVDRRETGFFIQTIFL